MRNRCPVCHMSVHGDASALVYQGIPVAFCSTQCRERFEANPRLYVGTPAQAPPRQQGMSVLKHRRFRLDAPLSANRAQVLRDAVGSMMGVQRVEVDGAEIRIDYDLLQATAEQIERTLVEAGARLGRDLKARLQRALVHCSEDYEAASREVPPQGHVHHR